jgi:hypothetical protein
MVSTIYDQWPFEWREAAARAVSEHEHRPVTAASLAHVSPRRVRAAVRWIASSHTDTIAHDYRRQCCTIAAILDCGGV